MDRLDIYDQYVGSRELGKLEARLTADIEDIVSAVAEHQDELPYKESAIALKRISRALTALEAVFRDAEYLIDGTRLEALRQDVDDYIDTLGVV